MQPFNAIHLDCLRTALELLDRGLKQNSLALTPLKSPAPSSAVKYSAFEPGQIAKPEIAQPIAPEEKDLSAVVQPATTVVETAVEQDTALGQTSLSFFGGLPWQVTLTAQIDTEAEKIGITAEKPLTGKAYFPSLPWAAGNKKAEAVSEYGLTEPSRIQLSGSFFKGITWDKASEGIVQTSVPVSAEPSRLAVKQELATGQAYFRSLQWATAKTEASVPHIEIKALTPTQQAGSFFKDIVWDRPSAPSVPTASPAPTTHFPTSTPQHKNLLASAIYFKEIPWQKLPPISTQTSKPDADRRWMAELATQNALTTAARGIEIKPGLEASQIYFRRVFSSAKAHEHAASLPLSPITNAEQTVIAIDDKQNVLTSQNQHYFKNLPWNHL